MKAHVNNDRIVPVTIAGSSCYFNFSLRAAKAIMQEFKSLENVTDAINEGSEEEAIKIMTKMYALMLSEGERYMRIVEKVEDAVSFTEEELETILSMAELISLQDNFSKAIELGSGREVETAPDLKNAKAARSK